MLDRSKAPEVRTRRSIKFPEVGQFTLDNGIPVYAMHLGTQDVVKLEVVYWAGRPFEAHKVVARATASQVKEGSMRISGEAFSEQIDALGATLNIPFNLDTADFNLFSLGRYFEDILPIFREVLTEPVFPEEELRAFIDRNVHKLKVELAKTDVLAYREVTERIFGSHHPYGYNSFPEDYEALQREYLVGHHRKFYHAGNMLIFISGRVSDVHLRALNREFGQLPVAARAPFPELAREERVYGKTRLQVPGSVQSAIRIGRPLFGRHHPDYVGMYVLNTILGGYFGSRLMENIREEKGYTYNVYSLLDVMRGDGCLYIGADVAHAQVAPTIREIIFEMDRLKQDLVEADELDMVKNYLMGTFLSMLDGPFNVHDTLRTMVVEDLSVSFFENMVEQVAAISAEELRTLAQKYLNMDSMWEVVAGELAKG